MPRLSPALLLTALLGTVAPSTLAQAKPWRGIEPGQSTKDEVLKAFGKPSKVSAEKDREVLGYFGEQAIEGTRQAQFKVDAKTGRVERIDVFVGPVIKRSEIEAAYGPTCPVGPLPKEPCHVAKLSDDQRPYFVYPQLGLAVFFQADKQTVQSLVFQPVKTTTSPAGAKAAPAATK